MTWNFVFKLFHEKFGSLNHFKQKKMESSTLKQSWKYNSSIQHIQQWVCDIFFLLALMELLMYAAI